MSTTPVPTPTSNTANLIALLEGFGNLALIGLQAGGVVPPGSVQIASMLEASLNNLVAAHQSAQGSTDAEVLSAYALLIAGFKAYQIASGTTSALSAKIGAYLAGTEAGLAGYVAAGAGYDPANYTQQQPIA